MIAKAASSATSRRRSPRNKGAAAIAVPLVQKAVSWALRSVGRGAGCAVELNDREDLATLKAYITETGKMLDSIPLSTWKDYSTFHFINANAAGLSLPRARTTLKAVTGVNCSPTAAS